MSGDALDVLYRAPLSEFVATRNQLAQSLKKAGDADGARRVQGLAKPSASAWAVNQLYWRERETFDRIIAAGDTLRSALESGPSAAAERARHDAVNEAVRRTKAIVEASGQNATETLMRRVATTLDALASHGSANPNPMRGRLSEDVEPPGFGAFASLRPALPESPPPTPEDEVAKREARVDRARADLGEAKRRVERLETELRSLRERLDGAHRRAEEAAMELAEAETSLVEARAQRDSP